MQRRDFLKNSMVLGSTTLLPLPALTKGSRFLAKSLTEDLPIASLSPKEFSSQDFNGDDINRPHDVLWNIDGYIAKKGGEPAVSEELDVVIVGGGISGLSAAYYLRHKKISLLEMDPRLGGNSKGEVYQKSAFSIGAAYIVEPDAGSEIEKMFKELGIYDRARKEAGSETHVFFKDKIASPFWDAATEPKAQAQFEKVVARLKDIYQNGDLEFNGELCKQWDSWTFAQWLENEFGELHPHLMEYFQLYGWSSFCASIDELSAFQFLNFICYEMGNLWVFPGGNSFIAHKLALAVRKEAGNDSLRSGSVALRVKTEPQGCSVVYEDSFGELKKVLAKKVIVACPKFVAKRIVPEMSEAQNKAIGEIHYRAYLVGNLILNKKITSPSFELFCMRGKMPPAPSAMNKGDRSFTDVCFGTWAQSDEVDQTVLTLYHGIPYDGARQFLFNPGSHDKYRDKYLSDVTPILSALGLSAKDILGLRMTRWGHALPVAGQGLIARGIVQQAASSINSKIFFANQDNWANPAFECGHQVAFEAAQQALI